MNIFKLFLFLLISPLVFTSCETSQTPVDELSSLLEKIDNNSENYSEEDWNNITNEFTEIEEELSKYEYTDEELKEIGRIKAYGYDWMEKFEDGMTHGKFTRNCYYEKSVDVFDFGKKNSQHTINYILNINIQNGIVNNNFNTIKIDETEFFK